MGAPGKRAPHPTTLKSTRAGLYMALLERTILNDLIRLDFYIHFGFFPALSNLGAVWDSETCSGNPLLQL
jgi:hypothetical protein